MYVWHHLELCLSERGVGAFDVLLVLYMFT